MIRELLQNEIAEQTSDKEVAVLLSGGVDSLSVAFAAQRLGKKITAYTFHLKDQPSYDALKAKEVSKLFGWDCVVVEVPTDNLENDFLKLVKEAMIHYGPGKTKEKFDEFRNNYFDYNNQAGYLWHELVARNNKKQFLTPYLSLRVKEFFYNMTWEELNKPF